MCNVWKGDGSDLLMPEHMSKLPPELKTINLTGGEPFLRDDLAEFVREARNRCPSATITISTNALLADRIVEQMEPIRDIDPDIRLAVSLDGVGKAHDRVRGTRGAFERAIGLIDRLKATGFRGLRLGMTLCRDNPGEVPEVARLADEMGLELGIVAAHGAETHLGVQDEDIVVGQAPDGLAEAFGEITSRWLRSWRAKNWLRAHFAWRTYQYVAGRCQPVRCGGANDMFFCRADGKVYSCSVWGREMGSLIDDEWADIWSGRRAEAAREFVDRCDKPCWMICTARSTYRRGPLGVLAWVAWNKLRAHLRLFTAGSPAAGPDLNYGGQAP